MLKFKIETITEELAQAYLATQEVNRPTNESTIRKYRNAIDGGIWALNGEAIKFDTEGHMRDGQHRCLARIGATRDFETLVIRGVDPKAQWTMDQGRVRQAGQQLAMLGVKDSNTVAAGIRLHLTRETGLLFRDNHASQEAITTPVIEAWAIQNRKVVDALAAMMANLRAADAPTSVAYAAALIFVQISPAKCEQFFALLAHGAGGAEHPITVLDKRLQRHRREGIKISNRDILGLYIQTWNAWKRGRTLTRFQRARGGTWTEATFPKAAA